MAVRLIAISGLLKGTTYELNEPEISVGREDSNAVCVNDPSISRQHCIIKRETPEEGRKSLLDSTPEEERVDQRGAVAGSNTTNTELGPSPQSAAAGSKQDRFKIIDLKSFNGTFVNGVPVKEHIIEHGDQIALGDVIFIFLTREAEVGTAAVQLDEADLITRSTIRLRQEDAFYLRPDKVLAELPATARVAQDLNALLKISTTINSISDMRELQHRLLELILGVIPAGREAILLVERSNTNGGPIDAHQNAFASICGWNRLTGPDDSIKVSKTITSQVLREVVALLSNDIFETQTVDGTPSLIASRVCSLLCVPLVVFEKPLGVIYLDTSDPTERFDEGHLQLLTAIASIAAVALENARHFQQLENENQRLQQQIQIEHQMVGESPSMRSVYQFIGKVAPTDTTVLIRGESGTGKELAAHAIHSNSARTTRHFVAINCATLTEALLETELFGHEKGAFTGAIAQKRGKLEIADGGTLFLDEVGELTPAIQVKLLRVLQERQFERVGGTRPIKVYVRLIAATNRDLEAAIKEGSFRQDLYYRLNVVPFIMPPLRDRREDIALLASFFIAKFSKQCKRRVSGLTPEARAILEAYTWPGNVREIENAVERAVVLGNTEAITADDLPEAMIEAGATAGSSVPGYYDSVREAKRLIIIRAVEQTKGSYTEAAKILGVHPNNLHRLIRSLNLKSALQG